MSAKLVGIEKVLNHYVALGGGIDNLEKPIKAAGVYMLGSIERNFKAQGRPNAWAALAPTTLAKRKKGKGKGGPQILIDTGRLKNSVTSQNALKTEAGTMRIGTNVVYARRQHFGFPGGQGRGRSKTPARPFLMFQQEDATAIVKIFNRWLEQQAK